MSIDPEAPLVDPRTLGRLRRLLGTQEFDALVRDSLAAYASYCETMLKRSSGPAEIAAEAHKLRGSAGSLGFAAISAAAARVESALESRTGSTESLVQELMQTIVATGQAFAAADG